MHHSFEREKTFHTDVESTSVLQTQTNINQPMQLQNQVWVTAYQSSAHCLFLDQVEYLGIKEPKNG